ncbi:methyltransferase [Nocardia sp. CA-151230]|uniref:methyltransferase n=1 Tax=Nocardia sp. CA-151230 TaxID=3239982 RepID=UPI003D8CEC5F
MTSSATETLVARLRAAGCVFAEDEAALLLDSAADADHLESLVTQRIAGFPLEHLLGWAEFRGLRVAVAPGVFVPRQRTSFLVEQAIALGRSMIQPFESAGIAHDSAATSATDAAAGTTIAAVRTAAGEYRPVGPRTLADPAETAVAYADSTLVVLDMCCGCGALGLAFAKEIAEEGIRVELTAADIEPAAVACARENLGTLGARVVEGDLFDPVPADLRGRVHILLANTPYVPSEDIAWMPPEARDHEPRRALDGGVDGLDVLRRIAAVAGEWLCAGGHLLVEESEEQAPVAAAIMREYGLSARIVECEDMGATVVIGTRT